MSSFTARASVSACANTKGDPPALPGRQQKFDSSCKRVPRSNGEVRNASSPRTKFHRWTGVRASEQYQGLIQRRILPCDTRNGSFVGGEGRLQAAHLSGPRSDPDAASSGPNLKAPGSAGGYLLKSEYFAI